MKDDVLNTFIQESIQELKFPNALKSHLVQLTVIPSEEPLTRKEAADEAEELNGLTDSWAAHAMTQARLVHGADGVENRFFEFVDSGQFQQRYSESLKGTFEGRNPKATMGPKAHDPSAMFKGLTAQANRIPLCTRVKNETFDKPLNLERCYLTVFSWRVQPDVEIGTQTIHVLTEIEKQLAGKK